MIGVFLVGDPRAYGVEQITPTYFIFFIFPISLPSLSSLYLTSLYLSLSLIPLSLHTSPLLPPYLYFSLYLSLPFYFFVPLSLSDSLFPSLPIFSLSTFLYLPSPALSLSLSLFPLLSYVYFSTYIFLSLPLSPLLLSIFPLSLPLPLHPYPPLYLYISLIYIGKAS